MGDKRKMTENEKIELFDKWYDENYDEWAEGEEGIALREELEQAFKSGIAELEKENAELKADNDARKFAMAMSEKVEKQLREEIAELKAEIENDRDIPAIAYMQGAETTLRKVVKYFSSRVLDENCGGYFSRLLESEEKLQELAKELENV